jgi:hypothetical protein
LDFFYYKCINMENKEAYSEYFDEKVPKWLTIIIFSIGVFGNLISIIVFSKMKNNSTYIYLGLLTIVDLFVLFLGLGDIILILYADLAIRNTSIYICRLHTFFTYTFTQLSSFILASLSIDRAIATNAINFARFYCKPTMAYKITALNFLLAVFINFHYLIFLGYDDSDSNIEVFININNLISILKK